MSKAEEKIEQIIISNNIKCIREKTFPNLQGGRLRYDFYLPDMNILIEYDSEIHFQEVPKFHHKYNDFSHAQQNDRLKNSYALSHSIPLYRIPYWEFNSIKNFTDIIQQKFLVTTKWWNDIIYRDYLGGHKIV